MSAASASVATVGHNLPRVDLETALEPGALAAWLTQQYLPHQARHDELMAAYTRFLAATAEGIHTDAVAAKATDFARQFKTAQTDTDATRSRIKAPVLAAQRTIDGSAKSITDPLAAAGKTIESRITAWLIEKERAARAAAEAEAAAKEAEAQRLMAEAVQTDDAVVTEAAVEAYEQAETAIAAAQAKPADLTRMHTPLGGVTSLRVNWGYEVEDITKVPAAYLTINDAVVKAAIRSAPRQSDGKPLIAIPGIRIVAEHKATIR